VSADPGRSSAALVQVGGFTIGKRRWIGILLIVAGVVVLLLRC
jgi:drug/metabolite transporter (DMT)-like permease